MLSLLQLKVQIKDQPEPIVDSFSLEVKKGESIALVGESGAGKSTVLYSIIGLLKKNFLVSGKIFFEGTDLSPQTEKEWRSFRGKKIGFVSQNCVQSFDPFFKVGTQFIELLKLYYPHLNKQERNTLAMELLSDVGLQSDRNLMDKYAGQLSGGMVQRLAIAFAIAGKPTLLLADELTSALDKDVEEKVMTSLLNKVKKEKMTFLWVTHDLRLAKKFADQIIVMKNGRVVEGGVTAEILDSPVDSYTKHLIASIPQGTRVRA